MQLTRTLDVRFEGEGREKRLSATLVASRGFVLHGGVRDPQGQPVVGARIESQGSPTVATDSDGRYRLEVATLGRNDWWYPRVNKDGYLEAMKNLDLTGKGPDVEVDFTLWKPAAIAGRVVDSLGQPVPDATVGLHFIEDAPNLISQHVKSDAAGAFRIDHAAEGTWSLEVSAVAPEGASYDLKRFQGLVDGGTSDYEVVLERSEASATIDVRVMRTSLGEPVVIEAADVIELSSRDNYRIVRAPRIDSSHVVAERLTVGRYRVSVIAGADFGNVEVEVPNPNSHIAVDLVFGVKGRVEGRVVSAGRSDTGCSIWLEASRGFQYGSSGPWQRLNAPGMVGVLQEIATADDGTFAFEAPVGSYRLRTIRYRTKPSLEGVTEIEVRAGETTNVEIQAYHAAILAFTLRGIPAGVALDAVAVDALGSERRLWNSSHDESERGALQETLFLKPGEVRWRIELTARTSGGQRASWCPPRDGKADLVAGEAVKVEIDFSKP